MLLKSIRLKNIRSYLDEYIEFPQGTVMLSGDIGSGKSTILLAIEFALFGLLRGELSGSTLLRHGKNEGEVELQFELEGTAYTIKRTLKRSRSSVEQEAGYLLVDGRRKDATAIELKTAVLEMLGYPLELVTKSKSLVYRYTVYTPQEEMKRILFEGKETRLAILRKVFGIDRYERIRANALMYTKVLRERKRGYEGMLSDAEEKKKTHEERQKQAKNAKAELDLLTPKLDAVKRAVRFAKEKLASTEVARQRAEELGRKVATIDVQLKAKQQQLTRAQSEDKLLVGQIDRLQKELKEVHMQDLTTQIDQKNKCVTEKEKELHEIKAMIATAVALRTQSEEIVKKIRELATCPLCLQNVTQEHKHSIFTEQQKKLIQHDPTSHEQRMRQCETELLQTKKELEQLRAQEKEMLVLRVKQNRLNEQQQRHEQSLAEQRELQQERMQLAAEHQRLSEQVKPFALINDAYAMAKAEVEQTVEQEIQIAIQHSALVEKQRQLQEIIAVLQEELKKKEDARKQLGQIKGMHDWLDSHFIPLMAVIERHVMAAVQQEFNGLFQQWFSMLVEDEIMGARLDEAFTPIITQNGYDTEVENLSGGERTACALAYRLALNKVVNDLISGIKTKNLLILDEPTDGFSAEQLDKMRDVLDQLPLKQIILVSHELKIESFVQSVVRVQKDEHISRILR